MFRGFPPQPNAFLVHSQASARDNWRRSRATGAVFQCPLPWRSTKHDCVWWAWLMIWLVVIDYGILQGSWCLTIGTLMLDTDWHWFREGSSTYFVEHPKNAHTRMHRNPPKPRKRLFAFSRFFVIVTFHSTLLYYHVLSCAIMYYPSCSYSHLQIQPVINNS